MNTSYGASNRFGHADYYGNLNAGMSNQAILDWINGNRGRLHSDRYRPGELYSQIESAALQDRRHAQQLAANQAKQQAEIDARAKAIANMQSSFDTRMAEVNQSMQQQAETYSTQLLGMQNTMSENQKYAAQQLSDQQKAYQDKLSTQQKQFNASQNPAERSSVLGVKGVGVGKSGTTTQLSRQGMKGSFGREGLRIKGVNL